MSSIFKGDSIYKSGGGSGGGYKDGGALVDADLIKVENNTLSTYANTSRDPINFYFDYKDGEIINSIIDVTTAINSTVNVYVLRNGLYYLLGNIGGNTLTANNSYKVNITGDSFSIEHVNGNLVPGYIVIGGYSVKLYKLSGNKYITGYLDGGSRKTWSNANNYVTSKGYYLPYQGDYKYTIDNGINIDLNYWYYNQTLEWSHNAGYACIIDQNNNISQTMPTSGTVTPFRAIVEL
jgi:hypothetical protein